MMHLSIGSKGYKSMRVFDRLELDRKRRNVDPLMATTPKHYVRQMVWLPIAMERHAKINRPLTYFTLTTADLFDVRVLERAGIIAKTERGYPGVGFCEFNDKTYDDISRKLRWCRWSHKGLFEDMVRQHPRFESDFDFDVINLDFILVPFPGEESPLEGTWGAIQRMLEVQWDHGRSFDLFLTFRGSRTDTNPGALNSLANLLRENLSRGRGVDEFMDRVGHLEPSKLLEEDYHQFLCMGLPKLLMGDALKLGYQVSRADVYSYPRQGSKEVYDIVKFVFGLETPLESGPKFAEVPSVVTNYEKAVPEIFAKSVVDVGNLIDADSELQQWLLEDLNVLSL